MSESNYQIILPIKLRGRIVKSGQVQLTPEEAQPWLESGSIEPTASVELGVDLAASHDVSISALFEVLDGLNEEGQKTFVVSLLETEPYKRFLTEELASTIVSKDISNDLREVDVEDFLDAESVDSLDEPVSWEEVFDKLDPDNPDHFTKTGKPEIKAMEEITGIRPSAGLRDAAWQRYQANKTGAAE